MVQNLTLPTGLSQGDPKLLPSSLCHRDLPTTGSFTDQVYIIGQNNDFFFPIQKKNVSFLQPKFWEILGIFFP
jgi:hypothetical protein